MMKSIKNTDNAPRSLFRMVMDREQACELSDRILEFRYNRNQPCQLIIELMPVDEVHLYPYLVLKTANLPTAMIGEIQLPEPNSINLLKEGLSKEDAEALYREFAPIQNHLQIVNDHLHRVHGAIHSNLNTKKTVEHDSVHTEIQTPKKRKSHSKVPVHITPDMMNETIRLRKEEGKSYRKIADEICRKYGRHFTSMNVWQILHNAGLTGNQPVTKTRSMITPDIRNTIIECRHNGKTSAQTIQIVKEQFGVKIVRSTVHRVLSAANLVQRRRTRKAPFKMTPEARKTIIAVAKEWKGYGKTHRQIIKELKKSHGINISSGTFCRVLSKDRKENGNVEQEKRQLEAYGQHQSEPSMM